MRSSLSTCALVRRLQDPRDGRKRSYQFELSIAEASLKESYFVVKFSYPADEADRRRAENEADQADPAISPSDARRAASPPDTPAWPAGSPAPRDER